MKLLDLFIEMFRPPPKKGEHELEIGVPRPTYVLAGLVKQKMLLDPDLLKEKTPRYGLSKGLIWEKDSIKLQWRDSLWDFDECLEREYRLDNSLISLSVNGKPIDASAEKEYLLAALKEVYLLKKERIKNKAFYDAQLAATEAIEHIMIGTDNENRTGERSAPRVLQEGTSSSHYFKIQSTYPSR